MEPREAGGKESMGTKRKNLTFLRPRLYMLERRKTDTVVDGGAPGEHSGALRRSQSDRTEYSQKLQEKMTPQAGASATETLTQEEHRMQRMMAKRSKIIKELIQTEKDYLNDLELCIREVVQPLRNKQEKYSCRLKDHWKIFIKSTATTMMRHTVYWNPMKRKKS
uniref:Rho guanine nucleotide exchange factor 38 n=1 Tax=Canis lupus familiaris TaxID=9615 RepID=A0A8P0TQE9_CANLF